MTWKISIKWNAQRCFKFSSAPPPSRFVNFARLSVSKFVGFAQLVPFVQFKNREKYSWRSVSHSKVADFACNLTKSNTPPLAFSTFVKL